MTPNHDHRDHNPEREGEDSLAKEFLSSPETARHAYAVLKQYTELRDQLIERGRKQGANLIFSVREIAGACNWLTQAVEQTLSGLASVLSTPEQPSVDSGHTVLPYSKSHSFDADLFKAVKEYVWRFNYQVILENYVDAITGLESHKRGDLTERKLILRAAFDEWRQRDESLLDLMINPHSESGVRHGISLKQFKEDYSLRQSSDIKEFVELGLETPWSETEYPQQHERLSEKFRVAARQALITLFSQGFKKELPNELDALDRPVDIVRDLIARDPLALENTEKNTANRRLLAAHCLDYYLEDDAGTAEEKIQSVVGLLQRQIERVRSSAVALMASIEGESAELSIFEGVKRAHVESSAGSIKARENLIELINQEREWLTRFLES